MRGIYTDGIQRLLPRLSFFLDWIGVVSFPLMFLHGYHGVLELLKTPFHSLTGLVLDDGL